MPESTMSYSAEFATLDDPFMAQLAAHLATSARTEDEVRVARIAAEAIHAFRRLADVRRAVAIFGSARTGPAVHWGELATQTAKLLAAEGFAVITGGGPGLMEAANAGAHAGSGQSFGLAIHLPELNEPLNPHVLVPVPFHYFFLRKVAFVKYSCAFVCMPGGYGTLDELFEALNLRRTHRIEPFPVMLLGSSYWSGLREWLRNAAVPTGALDRADLEMMEITDDPEAVVARVRVSHAQLCRNLGITSKIADRN